MKLRNGTIKTGVDPDDQLRLKLQSRRIHQQIVTNRKRYLYVEVIDDVMAMLTIETEVMTATIQHRSNGKLKQINMTNSKSNNLGRISKYVFVNLVKPIYISDIQQIVKDFEAGRPINEIKYSNYSARTNAESDAATSLFVNVKNALYASSHKNSTFTNRFIKSISNLIGL